MLIDSFINHFSASQNCAGRSTGSLFWDNTSL